MHYCYMITDQYLIFNINQDPTDTELFHIQLLSRLAMIIAINMYAKVTESYIVE